MALDIRTVRFDDFLEVVLSGSYDMQEAIDRFPHVLSSCRFTGVSKVLVDFRDLAGTPAATEKILYALGIREHYWHYLAVGGHTIQFAYVGKEPAVSTYEPGLELAQETNIPISLFTTVDKAFDWLGVCPYHTGSYVVPLVTIGGTMLSDR